MKKILLNGVDGNFGGICANVLLEKWNKEDLIFTAPTEKSLEKFKDSGVTLRVADFNDEDGLVETFKGADTVILISMPFVGRRKRASHKRGIDACKKANVNKVVYTSIVGAGEKDIDTYEVNDHVYTEAYIKESGIHFLFMRDSQYAEAMVSNHINAYTNTGNVLANNMGQEKMVFISRDDCAVAAAYAAMSDWQDRVVDVNGYEPLTVWEYIEIANKVAGHNVKYIEISDEEQYKFFDSIGVPRTTEEMWAQTATNFPFYSDGMVTFGRAIRLNQMSTFTNDFEELVGRKPVSVKEIFENMEVHLIGSRTSTNK